MLRAQAPGVLLHTKCWSCGATPTVRTQKVPGSAALVLSSFVIGLKSNVLNKSYGLVIVVPIDQEPRGMRPGECGARRAVGGHSSVHDTATTDRWATDPLETLPSALTGF